MYTIGMEDFLTLLRMFYYGIEKYDEKSVIKNNIFVYDFKRNLYLEKRIILLEDFVLLFTDGARTLPVDA